MKLYSPMLRQLSYCVVFLSSSMLFSQDILWEKSYGGIKSEYLTDAIPTADYGFIIGGSSLTPNKDNPLSKGNYDYCIWKISEDGNIEWQKSFGGNENDMLYSIKATSDGGYILGGTSNSSVGGQKKDASIGQNDIWILKLDARGNEMWQKTIGGLAEEQLASLILTKDNGYLIGASSESDFCKYKDSEWNKNTIYKSEASRGSLDYWLVKLNNKGNLDWQKTIGGNYLDQLRSIVSTTDGGYFIGGISNSNSGNDKLKGCEGQTDYWYMKLSSKGEMLWQNTYGGTGDENVYTVLETKDQNLLLGGNTNSETTPAGNSPNGSDFMLLKLDATGTVLWEKLYDVQQQDIMTSVIQNKDESLVICGYSRNDVIAKSSGLKKVKAPKGMEDYILIKTDKNGEQQWENYYGSDNSDVLSKAIETRDGGYLLAGTSQTFPSFGGELRSGVDKNTVKIAKKNEQLQQEMNDVNQQINDSKQEITDEVNTFSNDATTMLKDKMGLKDDSPLSIKAPTMGLNGPSLGDGDGAGMLGGSQPQSSMFKPSGDKKTSMGGSDFWVVKIRDKDKKVTKKATIEAIPNPAATFTNVIVGYDFKKGTATVVDLAGHILQQFEINSRTVPIDLQGYPEGIYIVNIKTDVQSSGVKVIKQRNRN
jgi:gas vesicle protein